MKFNISELKQKRADLQKAMKNLIEERGENVDEATMNTVKTFKDEISQIDKQVEAIEEYRSVAMDNTKPEDIKTANKSVEHRALFNEYMRGDIGTREFEKRASLVSANGSVVPDEFLKELQETILEYGVISPSCRHIMTEDNGQLTIPVIDDTANAGVWTAEAVDITKADFATSAITMDAFKVTTGIQVSSELLEDTFFDLESYLAQAFGTRLARTMENAYIFGTGTTMPVGIAEDAGTIEATSAVASAVDSTDLLTAIYDLQPTSRAGAVIYVSDDLMKDLSLEVDTTGRLILQAQAGATHADPVQYSLGGYPIVVNYELEAVADASTSAVIGNPMNYMVRDVRNVKFTRDEYTDMGSDMVNFYATARVDGKVVSANDAFVKMTTASV